MAGQDGNGKITAALVLGIVGGVFGIIAGLIAMFVGGLGAAFEADGADTVGALGFAAVMLGVVGIVGGALARGRSTVAAALQAVAGIGGFVAISAFWLLAGPLLVIGAVLAFLGRPKKATQAATTAMAVLALGLMVAACSDPGPASGSGADLAEDADDEAQAAEDEEDDEDAAADEGDDEAASASDPDEGEAEGDEADEDLGTRDNPLALGTEIVVADWHLTVTDVELDAEDAVMAENEFNDPPADGRQFVMFTVNATYQGDDSGDPWLDFDWALVGSEGNTFGDSMDDDCGVIPDALTDQGETYPDGAVEGNVCFSVASDQLDGATIRIEELISFEDTRAFFALE